MRAAALTDPGIWLVTATVALTTFAATAAILDALIDLVSPDPLTARRAR